MDSESSSLFHASKLLSKRLQSRRHEETPSSRDLKVRMLRDLLSGMEEDDDGSEEDSSTAEFACPFCYEDFDVVGLRFHVEDEHPVEAKNGVCPVCASRVGPDLVGHITSQHGSFYKIQRRRRLHRGTSTTQDILSRLKRDLKEGTLQTLLRDTSYSLPANTGTSDPFLSSLIYSIPEGDARKDLEPEALEQSTLSNKPSDETAPVARNEHLSDKDLKEQATRSKFMQELVLSTIFDDIL